MGMIATPDTQQAPQLDDAEASRVALEEKWRRLAQLIDEAQALKTLTQLDPAKLEDRNVRGLIRWASVFEPDLGAVQAIYEASSSGVVKPEQLRSARMVADKLLQIAEEANLHAPALPLAEASGNGAAERAPVANP